MMHAYGRIESHVNICNLKKKNKAEGLSSAITFFFYYIESHQIKPKARKPQECKIIKTQSRPHGNFIFFQQSFFFLLPPSLVISCNFL
jgi:hypothetical protein